MAITGDDAKKLLKAKADAIMKAATRLAREHIHGYRYEIKSRGALGAWITLEHIADDEKYWVHLWLKDDNATIGGGIYNDSLQTTQAFIDMLNQAVAIVTACQQEINVATEHATMTTDNDSQPASSKPDSRERVYFFRATWLQSLGDGACEVGAVGTSEQEARENAIDIFGHNHAIHELVAVMPEVQP